MLPYPKDLNELNNFICGYNDESKKVITIFYGDGTTLCVPYSEDRVKLLNDKMEKQLNESITRSKTNEIKFFRGIKVGNCLCTGYWNS